MAQEAAMSSPRTEPKGWNFEQSSAKDFFSDARVTRDRQNGRHATPSQAEVINSAELARRLGVPESWVRSRSNPKRTDDPIPHYKFGRYVQFPWGSEVLREWLNRQLVSTDRAGHSRRNE